MCVDINKQYEFITSQIRSADEKIIGAFMHYIKLTSAIVGGFVWLNISGQRQATQYKPIAVALLILVAFGSIWMIFFHAKARWGYRQKESKISSDVKAPSFPRTVTNEIGMILAIITTLIILLLLSP